MKVFFKAVGALAFAYGMVGTAGAIEFDQNFVLYLVIAGIGAALFAITNYIEEVQEYRAEVDRNFGSRRYMDASYPSGIRR